MAPSLTKLFTGKATAELAMRSRTGVELDAAEYYHPERDLKQLAKDDPKTYDLVLAALQVAAGKTVPEDKRGALGYTQRMGESAGRGTTNLLDAAIEAPGYVAAVPAGRELKDELGAWAKEDHLVPLALMALPLGMLEAGLQDGRTCRGSTRLRRTRGDELVLCLEAAGTFLMKVICFCVAPVLAQTPYSIYSSSLYLRRYDSNKAPISTYQAFGSRCDGNGL